MANEQQIVNKYKKGHYTRLGVLQSLISPWKGKEKKTRRRSYYNTGYLYLVTHPSTNPAEQGLTLLSGQDVVFAWQNLDQCFKTAPQLGQNISRKLDGHEKWREFVRRITYQRSSKNGFMRCIVAHQEHINSASIFVSRFDNFMLCSIILICVVFR